MSILLLQFQYFGTTQFVVGFSLGFSVAVIIAAFSAPGGD